MSKKILFVAVFTPDSTNVPQAQGFRNIGYDVIEFDYRKNTNWDEIPEICRKQDIEFVIFSKCNEIPIHTVRLCKPHTKVILWYMDPMNGNYCTSLIQKAEISNYIFVALTEPYKALKEINNNTYFLQEGFNAELDKPMNVPYLYDVSFIGNLRQHRAKYCEIANKHWKFKNITDAYREKHAIAVGNTKINLNFTHGGTSDRTYKVLAAKGFLLTESWDGMENDFQDGIDLVTFEGEKDFIDKINYYLTYENERDRIREHGYKTVQKFSRDNWAQRIIEIVK